MYELSLKKADLRRKTDLSIHYNILNLNHRWEILAILNINLVLIFLFQRGDTPPIKVTGVLVGKFRWTPLKGTRILFYGRVPNSFPSLRGTNSTTTNYTTGTPNFNSNENSFRTLSSQRLFESIVINLTETTLAAVILDLSTRSGTNPQI